jgi:cell division protein FtsI/penicillin-binding protein 2
VSSKLANRRLRLLLVLVVFAFGATLARAAWLQAVRGQSLGRMASRQHREVVTLPAGRGTIFDRTGVQLAIGEQATTVYADPKQIRNARAVALAAAKTLGVNANALYPQLLDRKLGFVYIQRKADPAKAAALEKRNLPGVGFYPEERRTYPQGSVAAQVLGYAGVDNHGLAGLELDLDKVLTGRPGKQTIVKDPFGRVIDVVASTAERDGSGVYLTLDHTIQANAESVLRAAVRQWHAKDATAIVIDPKTGGILAMAVVPSFNANAYPSAAHALQRNRAVTDTYEPGSTFKLVTVAGALSEHLVSATTPFTLPYSIRVADRIIHDAEPRPTETLTVGQILSHSSNVGAITLAEMLGPNRLMSWISSFGFGQPTGIDFPGESPGIVLPLDRWSGSTIGNVPIGQGIAVTPVQMAAAYAAIANGGLWTTPHLVDHTSGGGRPHVAHRRIVSRKVAAQLVSMLQNVVAEGTGTLAAVPGYRVAGKTGTAAKPDGLGGYSTTKYVASFVGMVPATSPRLVILVSVDEPRGAIWGGVVAAPIFSQLAQFDMQYLAVPPDDPASLKSAPAGGAPAPTPTVTATAPAPPSPPPPPAMTRSTTTTSAPVTYAPTTTAAAPPPPPVTPPTTSSSSQTAASGSATSSSGTSASP